MLAQKSNTVFAVARALVCREFRRTYYKKHFSYLPVYGGKFDYHDIMKYPRRMPVYKEEELLEEVHAIRALELDNPSPFHVVRRVRPMAKLPWTQKVTLRRLNLHSSFNGESVIVPNTPQFNAMLSKVKHLLQLKPAKFLDGRVPKEEDIGALKICPYTGTVKIDERLRLQMQRLCPEKTELFQGNHLRAKLNQLTGLRNPTNMR